MFVSRSCGRALLPRRGLRSPSCTGSSCAWYGRVVRSHETTSAVGGRLRLAGVVPLCSFIAPRASGHAPTRVSCVPPVPGPHVCTYIVHCTPRGAAARRSTWGFREQHGERRGPHEVPVNGSRVVASHYLPCRARSTGMSVPRRARRRSAGARLLRTREVARVATSPPSPHEPTDGHVGMGPREWVVCSLECPRAARLVHEGCDRGGRLRAAREAARKSRGGPRVFL